MKTFMRRKMREIFQDFEYELSCVDRLCELKSMRFDYGNIPDYKNILIQQLYLLRYFPAYLAEYYLIYKDLINLNFLNHYNVLSIGCGANVDFYGLYFALEHHGTPAQWNGFSYQGLDMVDWHYKETLDIHTYDFTNTDIMQWNRLDADDYNVIIFPKSIGEFDGETFAHFLKILKNSNLTANNIALISSIRQQHGATDMRRFESITNLLTAELGFHNLDNCHDYLNFPGGDGLSKYCIGFEYPDQAKLFINNLIEQCPVFQENGEPCEWDCVEALNRNPILTARYIVFQINRFTRE